MSKPGYRWYVGDLRTGQLIRQVDLVGNSWSTDITAAGLMGGSFPLRSMEWPDVKSDTASPKAYLAVSYTDKHDNETFIEAGPLTPGDFEDDAKGTLAVGGAGLLSYYGFGPRGRKLLPPMAPGTNPATQSLTFQGNELGLIAKRVVQVAHMHLGGAMPVVFPDDADLGGAGTAYTRIYPGHELRWVGEVLKQLSEDVNGPEIQFVPRRRTDDPRFLEWVMRIGTAATDYEVRQTGAPWVFDRSASESPIQSIKVTPDSSRKTYRSFAAGPGDAEARVIGWSENLDQVAELGYALVESEASATDNLECLADLEARTDADIIENARSFEVWTVKVHRDSEPNVGLYRPGDVTRIRVAGHYYIDDGEHPMRILRMAGDESEFVELQMAPVVSAD